MELIGRTAAFAKLNLILRIEGRRQDGFHQLRMLNVPIDLADEISIHESRAGEDSLQISFSDMLTNRLSSAERATLADPKLNSCLTAVRAFRLRFGVPNFFAVELKKNIPAASGFGGGSSDAAALLRILGDCFLKSIQAAKQSRELSEVAASVGADVPFFLEARAAEVTGIGEKVLRIESHPLQGRDVLLLLPPFGCSTPEVYAAFKKRHPALPLVTQNPAAFPFPNTWTGGESLSNTLTSLLQNDLFEAAVLVQPRLKEILAELRLVPDSFAALTGSGSAFFLLPYSRHHFSQAQRDFISAAADKFGCVVVNSKIL